MNEQSIEFESVVLNELKRSWHRYISKFNWSEYNLLAPNFRIMDASYRWGQWSHDSREMSFSRSFVAGRSWNEVLETLKHEMVHQFVSEVLHLDGEDPHGPTFRGVCKKYGVDAAPRGTPGSKTLTTTNHIVERIQHLLKLAENAAATEAESKAAASAAHHLMLKYNIELQAKNEEVGYTIRYVGGITGRIQAYMSDIANLLSKYYFVEIIWMTSYDPRTKKAGHELEISGREDNVEVAEYVYDFLARSAVEAWEKKFANPVFKMELQTNFAKSFRHGSFTSPRGYTLSARSNFLEGFILGFTSQLQKTAVSEEQAGLVLAKDTGLEEFYHNIHPRIRQSKGGGGKYNSNMRNAGYVEGSVLKITSAVKANKTYTPLLGK